MAEKQHGFELMVRADDNTMKYACTCGWVSAAEPTFTQADQALASHLAEVAATGAPIRS
jgi:hypothetical protein